MQSNRSLAVRQKSVQRKSDPKKQSTSNITPEVQKAYLKAREALIDLLQALLEANLDLEYAARALDELEKGGK